MLCLSCCGDLSVQLRLRNKPQSRQPAQSQPDLNNRISTQRQRGLPLDETPITQSTSLALHIVLPNSFVSAANEAGAVPVAPAPFVVFVPCNPCEEEEGTFANAAAALMPCDATRRFSGCERFCLIASSSPWRRWIRSLMLSPAGAGVRLPTTHSVSAAEHTPGVDVLFCEGTMGLFLSSFMPAASEASLRP